MRITRSKITPQIRINIEKKIKLVGLCMATLVLVYGIRLFIYMANSFSMRIAEILHTQNNLKGKFIFF